MDVIATTGSEKERAHALLKAYSEVPNDADIEVQCGTTHNGMPAVLISIGAARYPILAAVARVLADAVADAIAANPLAPLNGFDNLILALRYGADEADKLVPTPNQQGGDHG